MKSKINFAINFPKFKFTVLFLLILLGLASIGLRGKIVRPQDTESHRYEIPIEIISSGRMVALLAKLDRAWVRPDSEIIDEIKNPKDQYISRSAINYSTAPSSVAIAPTQDPLLSDELIATGDPIVSLIISRHDLYDSSSGLFANPLARGRDWEKAAYLSFYDQGVAKIRTGLGVRISGGQTRNFNYLLSFRLYFRGIYGKRNLPSELIFNQNLGELKTLILHSDLRKGIRDLGDVWQFVNPFSYDLARKAGILASNTRLIKLYLNGEYRGIFVATERQDEHYLKRHFGHKKFVIVDLKDQLPKLPKVKHGDLKPRKDFIRWVTSETKPLTVSKAMQKVDLRSLMTWFLLSTFSANSDPFQGYAYLDQTQNRARWFWSVWDMDHGFRDIYGARRDPWNINTFAIMLKDKKRAHILPEIRLIRRLKREDPKVFASFVSQLYQEIFNHLITPKFVNSRIDFYEKSAHKLGSSHLKMFPKLKRFWNKRPQSMHRLLNIYFNTEVAHSLQINAPNDVEYFVDGFRKQGSFKGWYFKNTPPIIRTTNNTNKLYYLDKPLNLKGDSYKIDSMQQDMQLSLSTQ